MKKKYLFACLIIILAIGINTFLYNNNNKYHSDDIKGAYGVVDYTKSKQEVHYLSEGWQLYLDEDQISVIDKRAPDSITGIYKPIDSNKAIYRIQILNDHPSDFYTLLIPEIFSEYALYINGQLIHQQSFIQTQQINVKGEEKLDCVLIINNQTHYYNGQVFPIIFGETNAVSNVHNLQNYSHSLLIFISLLSTLIMFIIYKYLGKDKKYLYASLLSLLMTIYLSHYFVHQFIHVSSFLTYLSEDVSYYMIFLVMFFFIYQFYCQKHIHKKLMISLSIGIVICCLLPYLFTQANHMIYYTGLFLKINIILLLLYTLFKNIKSSLIYYSILFFIISYSFDFIYDFEPIYFGWNTEIAAIILLITFNISAIQKQINFYKANSILKEKTNSMIEYTHTKAHDLKAPVATMRGYIDLLHEELTDDEKTHLLDKMEEKISTLTLRMNQLQNLEYETCILNLKEVNLKDFLSQIILEFEPQARHKKISIHNDLIDIDYNIDSDYFKIVIENIMMNALEHTHESEIFIRSYQTHQTIQIEVMNHGDIIPPDQLLHIFEQGFSTKGLSRGYGLYISKKIVEAHHAKLLVDSNKQSGTCFTIILPI